MRIHYGIIEFTADERGRAPELLNFEMPVEAAPRIANGLLRMAAEEQAASELAAEMSGAVLFGTETEMEPRIDDNALRLFQFSEDVRYQAEQASLPERD
jgi:hypothetical protein